MSGMLTESDATSTMPVRLVAVPSPTDQEILDINTRFALSPVTADQVFTFGAPLSSDGLDSYFTRMDPATTLRNFAADFTAGQALLDSHNQYELDSILGRSFGAILEPLPTGRAEGETASMRALVRWYMLRGNEKRDEVIRSVLGGVIAKMSVGFGGNDMWLRSDQDGKDMWVSAYFPGQPLDPKDGSQRATFTVVDGHGMEGSFVYKNSTPGANEPFLTTGRVAPVIARLTELAQRNEIPREQLGFLSGRMGVRFVGAPQRYFVGAPATATRQPKEGDMSFADLVQQRTNKTFSVKTRHQLDDVATKAVDIKDILLELLEAVDAEIVEASDHAHELVVAEERASVAQAVATLGITLASNPDAAAIATAVRAYAPTLATLKVEADEGRAARGTLEAETLAEGVRAFGNDFKQALYEPMLKTATIEQVRQMKLDWTKLGDERNAGGRSTIEGEGDGTLEGATTTPAKRIVDMAAYRIG